MAPALSDQTANHPFHRAGAILTIDLEALAANYRLLQKQSGTAQCAAVIKADGYGIGARHACAALYAAGCRWFFVATADEALDLRNHFSAHPDLGRLPVAVLNGPNPYVEQDFAQAHLVPVLNDLGDIQQWTALAKKREEKLPAILHVDTGMNRLGLDEKDFEVIAENPALLDGLDLKYIMSHLVSSEDPDSPLNPRQLTVFRARLKRLPKAPVSLCNSSGIFLGPEYHFHLTRPGVALYGGNPTPGKDNPMENVIKLEGRVLQIRQARAGETVGYNATYTLKKNAPLATISVGYADGYLRSLSNAGHVYFKGIACPVVGRVSMDLITADLSPLIDEKIETGDLMELIGPRRPVDAVAAEAGTISYEILTGLGKRYHRVYKGEILETAKLVETA